MRKRKAYESNDLSALVVEGGAMRGIFAAGVLDTFISQGFNPFSLCIGVSAGATNLSGYLAHMKGRNMTVITKYSTKPEFINLTRFLQGGDLLDLDWLWDISLKELDINIDKIMEFQGKYLIGVTNIETGKAEYIEPRKDNINDVLKASSALPLVYRKYIKIDNKKYADGGIADPIPVIEAYNRGAKNIMVIRSRPVDYSMAISKSYPLCKLLLRNYPELVRSIKVRANVYQKSLDFMRNPPKEVNVLEINPPNDFETTRLTTDSKTLIKDYEKGVKYGKEAIEKWHKLYSHISI
ncbi:patatin family protein [Clostridium sp. D2Q-11]|uniref:Patatin family protein n=1 Tax=Anaeromonas frigoriresistens TaxID=2683708 RepID=A0A942Z6M7_9FIRM|nr:patatin family protein [Anaeromonas frigoriresistens]MBS4538641.1 patatin family protein [Anaeromonas frigoriresistens]